MINVPNYFHTYALDPSGETYINIYTFPNGLSEYHFDDDRWVQTNGTLLARPGAQNSNGIISQKGIKISDVFSKSDNPNIGESSSKTISISFINDEDVFSGFDWSRPFVVEFFYARDDLGIAYAPLGAYWFERPTITTGKLIEAKAHDAMYMLDQIPATDYIANEWNSSGTLGSKITALNGYISKYYVLVSINPSLPNIMYSYAENPFPSDQISLRKAIEYLAGVMGKNARVNASNRLTFTWSEASGLSFRCVDNSGNPIPNNIMSMEFADFATALIDKVCVASGSNGFVGESPSGAANNPLRIYNNPLFIDASQVQAISSVLTDSVQTPNYNPSTITMYADVSLEVGDRFSILTDEQNLQRVWIIQQTLEWHGGPWIATIVSSGTEYRVNESQDAQEQYGTELGIYEAKNKLQYYDEPSGDNYTIGNGNFLRVNVPAQLSGKQILAITPLYWGSNTGAFSLLPYGDSGTYWYIVGDSGTVINGLQVRYWYI